MQQAVECNVSSKRVEFSPEDRSAYEESLKYYRDIKNVVDTSREEGIEEGIAKGIAKGREEGLEAGKVVGLKQVATMMKQAGETLEKITAYTGLSPEEIEQL